MGTQDSHTLLMFIKHYLGEIHEEIQEDTDMTKSHTEKLHRIESKVSMNNFAAISPQNKLVGEEQQQGFLRSKSTPDFPAKDQFGEEEKECMFTDAVRQMSKGSS